MSKGGNGLPVPITARPSVQAMTSGGRRLGARGRVRQREDHRPLTDAAIVRTTFSGNAPGWPETPISTVGLALRTTSPRPIRLSCSSVQPATALRGCAKGSWKEQKARHALDQEAVAVDEIEAPAGLRLGQAVLDHGAQEERADAGAGAARAHARATRCSRMGTPVTFTAASSVPAATAAVPWMSSLKVQSRSR